MEWVLGVLAGVSLAAACGFRVFVPMLVMGIAIQTGHLEPASGFQWLGSWLAIVCFGVATVVEIVAYFIPVVNNALDTVATPAAAVAGTILTASMIGDVSPWFRWILAAIAGGAAAGGIQIATISLRSMASAVGGSGAVSAAEDAAAAATSVLAVILPALTAGLLLVFTWWVIARKRKQTAAAGIR